MNLGFKSIATQLDRDPETVFGFIKKKVGKGDFERPVWMQEPAGLEKAQYVKVDDQVIQRADLSISLVAPLERNYAPGSV